MDADKDMDFAKRLRHRKRKPRPVLASMLSKDLVDGFELDSFMNEGDFE